MADADKKMPLPPYLPYKTFLSFLDHLKTIGMPSHIDKSVMPHLSGAIQGWLKSALKYMKLVRDDDSPDPKLDKLVTADADARKTMLRELFDSSYAFLKSANIDLKTTTPQKLRAAITNIGAQGDTAEKVQAFMIAMAKDVGLNMSPLLAKRAASVRKPRTPKPKAEVGGTGAASGTSAHSGAQPGTLMKSIAIGDGELTLTATFNPFALTKDEREVVYSIIDQMTAFESSVSAEEVDEE